MYKSSDSGLVNGAYGTVLDDVLWSKLLLDLIDASVEMYCREWASLTLHYETLLVIPCCLFSPHPQI